MLAVEDTFDLPVVSTANGRVRGHRMCGLYGEPYYCFDGIPYAAPPIGALRFKAPESIRSWHGLRDCQQPMPKCLQLGSYTKKVEGDEDCLYLNVYTKRLSGSKPLPVMVYLHGGGFKSGDATRRAWAPDYFMHEEVVLITIGYRLGVFGFLSFADPTLEIPGNAGLKDIILALKWIKQNCINFNGDPDCITLFGHSSGAMAVHLLMLSPQTQGLFHRAILMAGYVQELNRVPNVEYRLAQHYGYEGPNIDGDVFKFLSALPPEKLADFDFWTEHEKNQGLVMAFTPCVEPYNTDSAVLLQEPIVLQRRAWSNRIPLMLGATSNESLTLLNKFQKENINEKYRRNPEYMLPNTLQSHCELGTQRLLAKQLIELHYKGAKVCAENARLGIQLSGYNFIYHSQHRLLQARVASSNTPNYLYRFDLDSPDFNFYRIRFLGQKVRGTGHVDELAYIFVIPATFKLETTRIEYATIKRMISMWTTFAATGNPNNVLLGNVKWDPVRRFGPRMCLNISEQLSFIQWPEWSTCQKMDALYEQAGILLF